MIKAPGLEDVVKWYKAEGTARMNSSSSVVDDGADELWLLLEGEGERERERAEARRSSKPVKMAIRLLSDRD